MKNLRDVPKELYDYFSRDCGKERKFKSDHFYIRNQKIRRVGKKTRFPGSEGIIIGLTDNDSTDEHVSFNVWCYGRGLKPDCDEESTLSLTVIPDEMRTLGYQVILKIGSANGVLEIHLHLAVFIGEVIYKATQLIGSFCPLLEEKINSL